MHTPLITGSDCEGAGEMFRVTTLDADNPPRPKDGAVDYKQDFFEKARSLTVSGQLNAEIVRHGVFATCTPSAPPSAPSVPTRRATRRNSG